MKPEFFKDEKILSLCRDARLTTIGLITLADDRGRLRDRPASILGDLYEEEDVTAKQIRKWLAEIAEKRVILRYRVDDRPFIWLPKFLRHQVVNKPTESELPPHPDDAWADIPIKEAYKLAKAQDDSGTLPVGLQDSYGSSTEPLPPHARTRAVPFRSSSKGSSQGKDEVDARARVKSASVDQDSLPANFPDTLIAVVDEVLKVLLRVQAERGGNLPTRRGVGLAVQALDDRDHQLVAGELEHWATAGTGARRNIRDWVATYRRFLTNSTPGSPSRAGTAKRASSEDFLAAVGGSRS